MENGWKYVLSRQWAHGIGRKAPPPPPPPPKKKTFLLSGWETNSSMGAPPFSQFPWRISMSDVCLGWDKWTMSWDITAVGNGFT